MTFSLKAIVEPIRMVRSARHIHTVWTQVPLRNSAPTQK